MKVMFTVLIYSQTHTVTFTVLYHFWSSYKVVFGHLYSVMLTILLEIGAQQKTKYSRNSDVLKIFLCKFELVPSAETKAPNRLITIAPNSEIANSGKKRKQVWFCLFTKIPLKIQNDIGPLTKSRGSNK